MEHVSPCRVEDLPLHVDDRQVPISVPHDALQGPLSTGQKGPEGSSETCSASLENMIDIF